MYTTSNESKLCKQFPLHITHMHIQELLKTDTSRSAMSRCSLSSDTSLPSAASMPVFVALAFKALWKASSALLSLSAKSS